MGAYGDQITTSQCTLYFVSDEAGCIVSNIFGLGKNSPVAVSVEMNGIVMVNHMIETFYILDKFHNVNISCLYYIFHSYFIYRQLDKRIAIRATVSSILTKKASLICHIYYLGIEMKIDVSNLIPPSS